MFDYVSLGKRPIKEPHLKSLRFFLLSLEQVTGLLPKCTVLKLYLL